MCGKVGFEVIQSPLREWEGAGRIGRGQGWGLGFWRSGATRPQSISKPPPGVGGGRPNRPGAGVGIGILAERGRMEFKPPPGVGGGRPNRPGVGVGTGPLVTHVSRMKADATRPLFCEVRAKRGQRCGR